MGFGDSSDPVLHLVIQLGLGVLFTSFLMLGLVVLLRLRLSWEGRRREAFLKIWRPLMAEFATSEAGVPKDWVPGKTVSRADTMNFLGLWLYYHESLQGEAKEHLNTLARQLGMEDRLQSMFRRGGLRERLFAITALGHMRAASEWKTLWQMTISSNPYLSLASARSMVLIDPKEAMPLLAPLIGIRKDWPSPKVASILMEAGTAAISQPLADAILSATPEAARRLIRYLTATRTYDALPALRRILRESEDPDILAACLRSLSEFSIPLDLPLMREYAAHESWFVRVQVATGLGKFGVREDEEMLLRLLDDPEWWVRYRAAQALAEFPGMTEERLDEMIADLDGSPSGEVLVQAREERRIRIS